MTIYAFPDFRKMLLPDSGQPLLGLDWGKRTMGIAISDHDLKVAMPLTLVPALKAVRHLHQLWQTYRPQGLVIGLPLSDIGEENNTCKKIRRFANILPKEWPIAFFDEHLSSHAADSICQSTRTKERLDDHAAAIVLQEALWSLAS